MQKGVLKELSRVLCHTLFRGIRKKKTSWRKFMKIVKVCPSPGRNKTEF